MSEPIVKDVTGPLKFFTDQEFEQALNIKINSDVVGFDSSNSYWGISADNTIEDFLDNQIKYDGLGAKSSEYVGFIREHFNNAVKELTDNFNISEEYAKKIIFQYYFACGDGVY